MDLDTAFQDAETRLIAFAGKPVVYRRGEYSCAWRAIQGSTAFESVESNRVTVSFDSTDFIGKAEELVLDEEPTSGPVTPQRGDCILKLAGTSTLEYEVLCLNSQPPYRYSDPERSSIRIHCKLVKVI
jgi:hypothetical protein